MKTRSAAALLLTVTACGRADGQAAAAPGPTQPAHGKASAELTQAQFVQRQERKMFAADTDGDGRISSAEFLAHATGGKGDPAKRFARLDTNGDGMLDKAEIDAMLIRRFHRIDTNGDRVISPQERIAARSGRTKTDTAVD